MDVRPAKDTEVEALAKLWHDGWRDAHAEIVPPDLTRLQTLGSFRKRIQSALREIRVVGPIGSPAGFCIIKGNELYQLYVSAKSRGSGVSVALIADAELRLAQAGVKTAWLSCAIGNDRAARFYEKQGWRRVENMINRLETPEGEFLLETWRYEKSLVEPSQPKGH